jgi:hypothetical protein
MIILDFFNFVRVLVCLTFFHSLINIDFKTYNHKLVFYLISITLSNEICTYLLIINDVKISFLTNIFVIINNTIWLYLIVKTIDLSKWFSKIPIIYFCAGVTNFLFIEGFFQFNQFTFLFGSIIYIFIFLYYIYHNLNCNNLELFKKNDFIMICSPVLFFLGLSLVFAFKNKKIDQILVLGTLKLYYFVNISVNIIYYTLINIYIYRERKQQHA